ncbi:MAG: hypothetical protein RBQ71_03205 [Acholeplasmataceae bacterium]|nr:hypothetical protein [Acholeplasmataceae bacterium]
MKKIIWITLAVIIIFLGSIGIQFAVNMGIDPLPSRPEGDYNSGGADRLLYYFYQDHLGEPVEGITLNDTFIRSELEGTFDYINGRYDVADFRVNALVRLYLSYPDDLNQDIKDDIKEVLLNFKYWMDQGGEDSMCFWSENHQILFASEEYLVGQTFPDEIFTVDGKTGSEHMVMAKQRIESWLYQRYTYGFTEWYSNNYYPEDIAPMSNLIQFANDQDLVKRVKIIMDLLWHDMASQSFKYDGMDNLGNPRTYYIFNSSSGRSYSDNRMSDDTGNRMRHYIDYVMQPNETKDIPDGWGKSSNGFFNAFRQMMDARNIDSLPYYEVPEVIKAIFDDPSEEKIIKSSQSLDVEELKNEGLLGQEDHQIMMQWAMEAFSNPEVVDNTITYISKNNMFSNEFLNDFKLVNLWPLRTFKLLDMVSSKLKPVTNGVAIERANVYTYKTEDFMMSTAQAYQVGEYADQHAVHQFNLSNSVSVFSTQPAKIPRRSGTPTYWVGNGRQPMSVQEKNVNITIYQPPTKTGFMEPMIVKETTHVFFPIELFDEIDTTYLHLGMIFGRVGDAMIGIRARYVLSFAPFETSNEEGNQDDMLKRGSVGQILTDDYDLIQIGAGDHYYVTEMSSLSRETFEQFKERMIANELNYDEDTHQVTYETRLYLEDQTSLLEVNIDSMFKMNSVIQDLAYSRFESPYAMGGKTLRKQDIIRLNYGGYTLILDFEARTRVMS